MATAAASRSLQERASAKASVVLHETLVAADHPGTLPNAKNVRRRVKDLRTLITDVVQLVSLQAWTHLLCALLENG